MTETKKNFRLGLSDVIRATELWFTGEAQGGPELFMALDGISQNRASVLATALGYVTGKRNKYARRRGGAVEAGAMAKRWRRTILGRWKELEAERSKPAPVPPSNGHASPATLSPDDAAALDRLIGRARDRLTMAMAEAEHWERVLASLEAARKLLA